MQSAKYQLLSKPPEGKGYPWLTYIGDLLQGLLQLSLFNDSQGVKWRVDSFTLCLKINGGKNSLEKETKWSNNYGMKQ